MCVMDQLLGACRDFKGGKYVSIPLLQICSTMIQENKKHWKQFNKSVEILNKIQIKIYDVKFEKA